MVERYELLKYGTIIALISMLISPFWDMATTALVTDWVLVCNSMISDPYFPLLAFLSMSRIEFWLKIWTFTFSGQTLLFIWINASSIIGALFLIMLRDEYTPLGKIALFFISAFTTTGLCQVTNSFEDWVGVFYRNLFGYDLMYSSYDIYGGLGSTYVGMMPLGAMFWVPWWVYIISRVGEGLLLVGIAFMLKWVLFERERGCELYTNLLLLAIASIFLLTPYLYI